MAYHKGRDILLKVSTGVSPASFATLAGLRTKSLAINNEPVDISNATTGRWRALLETAGLSSLTISAGIVFNDDAAANDLQQFALNNTHESYRLEFNNGDAIEGTFMVASLTRSGDHNAAEQWDITLESAEAPNYIIATP